MYIAITRLTYNCAHLRSTKESLTFEYIVVDTLWYWVSRTRYWLVLFGTGSIRGGTGQYLGVLGQLNSRSGNTSINIWNSHSMNQAELSQEAIKEK